MQESIDLLYAVAKETAVAAGRLAKEMWSQPRQISEKGFRDLVTDADIATQALITDVLQKKFPDHGYLTEEEDSDLSEDGPIIWIIDPIDGTTNYSRQQPIYCVSLAATHPLHDAEGNISGYEPIVGIVYDPMQDELFHAAKGMGAWLGDRQLKTSSVTEIGKAIIGIDRPYNELISASVTDLLPHFGKTVNSTRNLGSATLAMAWVAAGRFDGYLNCNLKPWDVAAAWLLIEEAGGQLSDIYGNSAQWSTAGMDLFCSNGRFHQSFINLLSGK